MNISDQSMANAVQIFKTALVRGLSIDAVEDVIGGVAFVFFARDSRAYIECHNDGRVICVFDDRNKKECVASSTPVELAVESVEKFLLSQYQ
jgi:hypothetical protein